jgi:CheY-like chemotaxis protein
MVVDDDDDLRRRLAQLLDKMQYDVTAAQHGSDALSQLRAGPRPDVILLDLLMPVMDGFALIVELRKDPELAAIPIVVFTSGADAETEATKLSAAGHIQKPFKADHLQQLIDKVLAAERH